MITDKDI